MSTLETDARAFHRSLSELRRILAFRDRDLICCYGVSITQSHALAVLAGGPRSLNDVAAELYIDKSTASRSVKTLEEKGLVRRRANAEDARAIVLELTAAGRRTWQKIEECIVEEESELLRGFDAAARQTILQFIGRLTATVGKTVTAEGGSCCRIEPA